MLKHLNFDTQVVEYFKLDVLQASMFYRSWTVTVIVKGWFILS